MAHKFDAVNRKRLGNEEQIRLLTPYETLNRHGFKIGDTMADIGCGTGLFTFPAVQITSPDAIIYAVNTSRETLDEVTSRANGEGLRNIVAVKSDEYDFKLKEESADFVLLCRYCMR